MSIASEITRLQNAKSALATSIGNKGVTVPSSTKLDGYAALVDSIGGATSIYNEIRDYMFAIVPSSSAYNDNSAGLFNFETGKTYRIIAKVKYIPSGDLNLFAYGGNANTPSALTGKILAGETMADYTYTHTAEQTYTRLGCWANTSGERNGKFSIVVYIKEIV